MQDLGAFENHCSVGMQIRLKGNVHNNSATVSCFNICHIVRIVDYIAMCAA